MSGPRLAFQLFLGWVLLMGQQVWGEESWDEPGHVDPLMAEELEARVRTQRQIMEANQDYFTSRFSDLAQDLLNKKSERHLYRQLEDGQRLPFKKAIGTMVYLRLFLTKTNCTNEDMNVDIPFDELLEQGAPSPNPRPCALPEAFEQEMLDCTFGLFLDGRSHNWQTVGDEDCRPVSVSYL